ncbi:MAG: hypothetical protein QOH92_1665 [Chloroflexota bacterium]|jgi:FlaA1/EpsC-like NDP-sugar epimerase|nr:hypothetical protein [Chloroflexota bacterium]
MMGGRLRLTVGYRRLANVAGHLALFGLLSYLAYWLRFGGSIPQEQYRNWLIGLPILLAIRVFVFEYLHIFEGVWIYTDMWDLRNIAIATVISSSLFCVVALVTLRSYDPRTIVIDTFSLLTILGGLRLLQRGRHGRVNGQRTRRVLIYGAGDAGAMLAVEMKSKPDYVGRPIAFLDDNPDKRGLYVHGLRVLGGREQLEEIMLRTNPDEVIIAMPSVAPKNLRRVVMALEPYSATVRTLPGLAASLGASLGAVRHVSPEDLLERPRVSLDEGIVREFVAGKRVLVTGAGGSIGSELIRQLARLKPARLIALDRYENGLFAVQREAESAGEPLALSVVVGDITDERRIEDIFAEQEPSIVFHAAAHKHVPLMEGNPCEAVKNNVRGTRIVAEAARRHRCQHFILISTDKAVNPSSVMGATKRAAESIVQRLSLYGDTVFAVVRFGNVLGSNGSVMPIFAQQISDGGPLTVTHAEARRYFMLISEAVQLVLHAATLAKGGEVFVLEMGEQVGILDVARDFIRLNGARPDRDVQIAFTGLRPGEKIIEELSEPGEILQSAGRPGIRRVAPRQGEESETVMRRLSLLEDAAYAGDSALTIRMLMEVVPSYAPGHNSSTNSAAPADAAPYPSIESSVATKPNQ